MGLATKPPRTRMLDKFTATFGGGAKFLATHGMLLSRPKRGE
jgi:hypothetical protein